MDATILKDKESTTLEAKSAANGLPKSIWETYSAFANTYGGTILLGVMEEKDGTLTPIGLDDPEGMLKIFWNTISNRTKVNVNLLSSSDVEIKDISGKRIIVINVPQATCLDKPIYLNGNISETYRRNGDGDYRCTEREIFAMIRDSSSGTDDIAMLPSMPLEALCEETVSRYRNLFASKKPDHIWATLSTEEFLYRICAIRKDADGTPHPTRAGLLMFGNEESIRMKYRSYLLEYIDRTESFGRWSDRITTATGTWSGNIFDFFLRVSNKLAEQLKRPFELDGFYRVDDTPLHKAVREALVNALIHADYDENGSTTIISGKDSIIFSNPGSFRIDIEVARQGGISDTRNPTLCTMFSLIDVAERAGIGLESIFRAWDNAHLGQPKLHETLSPARSILELPLIKEDMLSEQTPEYVTAQKVLDYIRALGPISLPALSKVMETSASSLRPIISKLVSEGTVKAEGMTRNRKYMLTQDIEHTDS